SRSLTLNTSHQDPTRVLNSRVFSATLAALVLFHCLKLFNSAQKPPYLQKHGTFESIDYSRWPPSLRKTGNISPHLSGSPFYCCSRDSINFQDIYHYSPPGVIANLLLTTVFTISSYLVVERIRKNEYRVSITLESIFTLITFFAINLAIFTGLEAVDKTILPKLELMRSAFPQDLFAAVFFWLGFHSFILVIAHLPVKLLESMSVLLSVDSQ
ncbi:MAG: hypothetical protein AAGA30_10870, partial [Planctomycetota bacterium]